MRKMGMGGWGGRRKTERQRDKNLSGIYAKSVWRFLSQWAFMVL